MPIWPASSRCVPVRVPRKAVQTLSVYALPSRIHSCRQCRSMLLQVVPSTGICSLHTVRGGWHSRAEMSPVVGICFVLFRSAWMSRQSFCWVIDVYTNLCTQHFALSRTKNFAHVAIASCIFIVDLCSSSPSLLCQAGHSIPCTSSSWLVQKGSNKHSLLFIWPFFAAASVASLSVSPFCLHLHQSCGCCPVVKQGDHSCHELLVVNLSQILPKGCE